MGDSADDNTAVISYRLKSIETMLASMSTSMEKLVVLEQKHMETREAMARSFVLHADTDKRLKELESEQHALGSIAETVEKHGGRITKIEVELPTLTLARGWVISGVLGIVAMLALTLFKLLVK